MRIARIVSRLNLGGPARQIQASDPLLRERGHELRLFCGRPEPGEGDLHDELVREGLDVVRVPGLKRGFGPLADWRARRFLRRELGAFAPDIVHTHATKAGALGRPAALLETAAKLVHTFHGHVLEGYFPDVVARRLVALEARLAVRTDRIVCVSHATADDVVRLGVCREEQVTVIPTGVRLERLLGIGRPHGPVGQLRELCDVEPGAMLVGVVGRLAEVKRVELAVEVFALLAERYPRLHLVFVGDGDQRSRLERVRAALPAKQRERVHLIGFRSDLVSIWADLDVCLLTSRSEGLPVALIEAAAASVPVVSTPVGGVPELVAHERTGFLGDDANELAFGLARYLDDPDERRAAGARGRLRVAERHGAPALTDRLEALYQALLDPGAGRAEATAPAPETASMAEHEPGAEHEPEAGTEARGR